MCRTCTDGHRSSTRAEIYRCGRRNCRSDSIADVNRVVRSQTTVSCRAPALHRPIVENDARMKVACSKCRCAATASERNWRGVGNCRRRAAIGNVDHRVLAQLSVIVSAPAGNHAVVEKRTGVIPSSDDVDRCSPRRKGDSRKT